MNTKILISIFLIAITLGCSEDKCAEIGMKYKEEYEEFKIKYQNLEFEKALIGIKNLEHKIGDNAIIKNDLATVLFEIAYRDKTPMEKEFKEIEKIYRESLNICDSYEKTWNNLFELYIFLNKKQKAISLEKEKRKKYGPSPFFNSKIADYKYDEGKYEQAIELSKQVINIDSLNSFAYYVYGKSLNALNKPREAITQLKQSLTIDSTYANVYSEIGVCYWKIDEKLKAEASYLDCIRYDKEYEYAYFSLYQLYLEQQDSVKICERLTYIDSMECYYCKDKTKNLIENYKLKKTKLCEKVSI